MGSSSLGEGGNVIVLGRPEKPGIAHHSFDYTRATTTYDKVCPAHR